jgi:2-haloacid dehalogenase
MASGRRDFLGIAAAAASFPGVLRAQGAQSPAGIEALAFDAFPVLDPRPVYALCETLFPGRGGELANAWRARQFEYQWLRTLSGRYADFLAATGEALDFAARSLKLDLGGGRRERLMGAWLGLRAWPDAAEGIRALSRDGLRLAFCSNMTEAMLRNGARAAGVEGLFEHVLSADRVRAHKPDPRAYAMAQQAFGLPRERILFVSFAGWDVAGARWFGYPAYWVNRLGAPAETLGVAADGEGRSLADLAAFVSARSRAPAPRPSPRS